VESSGEEIPIQGEAHLITLTGQKCVFPPSLPSLSLSISAASTAAMGDASCTHSHIGPPPYPAWVQNGALLKGIIHTVKGAQHLQVLEQVPAGGNKWQPVASGKWMPADGGSSNGGQWLHAPDREVEATAATEPALSCPRPGASV
jgi:hypothetical protein